MQVFGGLFVIVWVSFWSFGTLLFDGMIVRRVWSQEVARSYPVVPGEVIASDVRESGSGEDTSYRPQIRFRYVYEGRPHEADTHSFHPTGCGRRHAQQLVEAHPVGRTVSVYVDPADPSRAILSPGIAGEDLQLVLFLTPFNVVMLGAWMTLATFALRRRNQRAGGVCVLEDGARVWLRLPPTDARLVAAVALAGFSIAAVLGSMLILGMRPAVAPMLLVVLGVLLGTMMVYHQQRSAEESGRYDLVLDRVIAKLTVPAVLGRAEPVTFPLALARGVQTQRHETCDSDGDAVVRWRTTLMIGPPGAEQPHPVVEFSEEQPAAVLTDWLQERLKGKSA